MDEKVLLLDAFLQTPYIDTNCAFVMDVTDVVIMRSPAALCRSPRLYVETDVCDTSSVKRWMQKTYFKGSSGWSPALQKHLANFSTSLWNGGIFGGRMETLRPFFRRYKQSVSNHMSRANTFPVDMLAFNEVVETLPRESFNTGFPLGTFNALMWGNVCCHKSASPCHRNCSRSCVDDAIERGNYFFAHKYHPRTSGVNGRDPFNITRGTWIRTMLGDGLSYKTFHTAGVEA